MGDNTGWLEAAKETFDMGVDAGDYETCLLIIDDVREKGFLEESRVLGEILLQTPLTTFTHPSNPLLWK